MKRITSAIGAFCIGSVVLCGAANGQVAFRMIGEGQATGINADGRVVVGNMNGTFEAFRWTPLTGIVPLGRPAIWAGVQAGTPDVSSDGTQVSATISSLDSTYATIGRWTEGAGWEECLPPAPPDGGILGTAYGSAWGISDDGKTVVGLYWRPGQTDGTAHAVFWTEATGAVSLGSSGRNSRANDANADGSVIVGWDEAPFGNWQPTVWDDGLLTHLSTKDAFHDAEAVTADGKMVVGESYNTTTNALVAAIWRFNGTTWDEQLIGALPGTFPGYGLAKCMDVTPDGSMVVGYNRFDFAPAPATGFIWTQAGGMVNLETFLVANGVTLPPQFDILGLNGVSDDGKVLCGVGQDTTFPFAYRSFLVYLDPLTGVAGTPGVAGMELGQNYPNPFNPATSIPLTVTTAGNVHLDVFNAAGQHVRTLHNGFVGAGIHSFAWSGVNDRGVPQASGVYFA
ncbi:MAG: hypothetical protein OEY69_03710, partial [Candidatus Krumholzibacteria bacterium]|nr:hypothetical protein [Candidatus Krumholzibacteria bacterium]